MGSTVLAQIDIAKFYEEHYMGRWPNRFIMAQYNFQEMGLDIALWA